MSGTVSTSSSASAVSFSGLASGLDTASIVSKMVSIEKTPATLLSTRESDAQKRLSILGDLQTKLQALQTAAGDLDKTSKVTATSASSSDQSVVQVSTAGTPGVAAYSITVNALARAQTSRSAAFASDSAGVAGSGTLTLQVGSGDPVSVDYDSSMSLTDIAAAINSTGAAVSASVLFDGQNYRLNVTGTQTGAANAIQFTDSGSLGLADPSATMVSASDSSITINGTTVTRPSNTLTDVAPGLTLNLVSTTPSGGAATEVQVTSDESAVRDKVQGLVDAYNAVAGVLSDQLSYSGTVKGEDTLFGDSTLEGLQRQLGSILAQGFPHGSDTLSSASLGISLQKDGTLTFNTDTFDAAVAADPTIAQDVIGGSSGMAKSLENLLSGYTEPADGIIANKQDSIQKSISSFEDQIQQINDAADAMGQRMTDQFSAMEQIISKLNSQASYISQIFNSSSSSSS